MNGDMSKRGGGGEIAKGIASCFALNVLHLGMAWLLLEVAGSYADFLFNVALVIIAGFGLLQLLYVVPLVLTLRKHERSDFAKGMIIAGSISLLLSAACWGDIANLTNHAHAQKWTHESEIDNRNPGTARLSAWSRIERSSRLAGLSRECLSSSKSCVE
jgi:hypothetical protein